jgi:glycosyltransferase involved in cell wall biosynthesis
MIVLMVSALVSSKRVGAGIEAVSKIPNAQLVIAGDGPLRETLDAQAAQLMPGRYTRLTVPPEQMPELYRSADVFVHLSKDESFGNVFIEAMACGLPVVGHDTSRSRWILGDVGFLLDTEDPAAVAYQINKLVCGSDPAAQSMRVARAEMFSWETIGEMYRSFLQSVVASYAKI